VNKIYVCTQYNKYFNLISKHKQKKTLNLDIQQKNNVQDQLSTIQTLQSSQGLNHQPKNIHGGTHDSSCVCIGGWTYLASMSREALPVKALCPSVGGC
jgi:excinuclease UvrABC nuclease subunit